MYIQGLDEDLAEAIDGRFFNSYVTWTNDNCNKSTTQKVSFLMYCNYVLSQIQVRQWVSYWHSHLGDRATPKALVDVIKTSKTLGRANKLKDDIVTQFNLNQK